MDKKDIFISQYSSLFYANQVIISLYFILVTIGLIFIFSISHFTGYSLGLNPYTIFFKQLLFISVSIISMIIFTNLDYKKTRIIIKPLILLSLLLLLIVFIPGIGLEKGSAKRWINLYFFSFNPSELAKLTLIFYLAHILVKKKDSITNFTFGLLPPLVLVGCIFFIILLQSGFSIGAIIVVVMFAMIFIGGASIRHILSIILVILPILILAIWNVTYRKDRLLAFIDPWRNPQTIGYQSIQSLQAIANGKIVGVGLGNSYQKLSRLPAAHTDFIFSVIVEETGLIGGLIIIGLFLSFFIYGLRIALKTKDAYGQLLAFGIVILITTHALLNIMIAMALLPPTGVSLPFISYGGSSFFVFSIAIGILLNISSQNIKPKKSN